MRRFISDEQGIRSFFRHTFKETHTASSDATVGARKRFFVIKRRFLRS